MPRTKVNRLSWLSRFSAILCCLYSYPQAAQGGEPVDFRTQVAPILERHCLRCHSDAKANGEFSLTSVRHLEENEYVVGGAPDASHLLHLISPTADMPPKMPQESAALSGEQIGLIRTWIAEGAHWPAEMRLKLPDLADRQWWSLEPIVSPETPAAQIGREVNPIDAFLDAKLVELGLVPVEPADSLTLIRRATYDLTGLAPTPQEIDAFLEDCSADTERAWRSLVDRLLDSSAFGEKWGQHWLDLARFAETHGYDKDKLRNNAWPYRDYVIRSFNQDKPYARFVREQIAGDVLFPGEPDGVLGLGFLAAGPWDFIGHWEVGEGKLDGRIAKHLDRDEMISTVFNVFMSTTVQCAQCHHHKFDPIRMEDYYRLHAVFSAVDRADRVYAGLTPQQELAKSQLITRLDELKLQRTQIETDIKEQIARRLPSADARIAQLLKQYGADQRLSNAQALAELVDLENEQAAILQEIRTPDVESRLAELNAAIDKLSAELKSFPQGSLVYAATTHFTGGGRFTATKGKPREIHLLNRGDLRSPAEAMSSGAPALWDGAGGVFQPSSEWTEADARAELARYLTRSDNPLVWRAMVNRVWQWTFGQPLVGTPNDFGRMGMLPTHPELLDYLAVRLRDDPNQSLKTVVRLLFTSHAYRRGSHAHPENTLVDAGNTALWRFHRRRLTAEEFRDSVLAVSGVLQIAPRGGPSFQDFVIEKPEHSPHYQYHLYDPDDPATHRRTVYRFVVRSQPQPMLTALDCADPSMSVPMRDESTTAIQALTQWNNRLIESMSRHFAQRLAQEAPQEPNARLDFACRLVFGRLPDESERRVLVDLLRSQGEQTLARVLLNTSAFTYVD